MAKRGRYPKIDPSKAAQAIIQRKNARRSLLGFCEYMHPAWESGEHHQLICDKLDKLVSREIHKLILNAPPRHSKSEIVSRMLVPYYLGKYPDHQIILASYSDQMAQDNSRDARNYCKDPRYIDLYQSEKDIFPGAHLDPETKAGSRWETTQGGVVIAAGIGGAITGRGAHLAIVDDPLKDRADADSARIRENVWKWYASVLSTRLMPGGTMVVMQTRWHEDDLAGLLMRYEAGQWEELVLPAVRNEHTEKESALWPSRYSIDYMRKMRSNYEAGGNIREWYSLYQQNPSPEEGTYCQREWFEERWSLMPKMLRIYMASDWAVTAKDEGRDANWTVHVVAGLAADGRLYMVDAWDGRKTPDETIEAGIDLVEKWKPMWWRSEKGPIRRAIEGVLERRLRERRVSVNLEWVAAIGDKQAKGRALQAWSRSKRVIFSEAPWAARMVENIIGFPTLRHDDHFDACAMMCSQLDEMSQPVSRIVIQKRRDPWQHIRRVPKDRWKTL